MTGRQQDANKFFIDENGECTPFAELVNRQVNLYKAYHRKNDEGFVDFAIEHVLKQFEALKPCTPSNVVATPRNPTTRHTTI